MGSAASVIHQFVSMSRAERMRQSVLRCLCGALLGKQGYG